MNDHYLTLANTEDSPDLLRNCVWALATFSAVGTLVMLSWLGIQRGKMIVAEQERDAAYTERDTEVRNLSEQLMKAQTAQANSESKLEAALSASAQNEEECKEAKAQIEQNKRELANLRTVPAGAVSPPVSQPDTTTSEMPTVAANPAIPGATPPSSDEVLNFVKGHLARMMGPVAGELDDYAEQVDFHDKPYASLQTIANDRERWAQKWPRRIIQMSGVMPQIDFNEDATYGWQAVVVVQWNWIFWNRSGMMLRGVNRDTWKIVPTAQGVKIISEHSVDAATGRSRD